MREQAWDSFCHRARECGKHPQVPWKAYLITLPGDEAKADFSLRQLRGLGLEVEIVHGINSTQARSCARCLLAFCVWTVVSLTHVILTLHSADLDIMPVIFGVTYRLAGATSLLRAVVSSLTCLCFQRSLLGSLESSPGLLNAHLFCTSCLFPSRPEANVFRPGWPAGQVRGMPAGRRRH